MNTLTLITLISGLVLLAGLVTLVGCALRAPEGHEDEQGFRLARQPAPESPVATAAKQARAC